MNAAINRANEHHSVIQEDLCALIGDSEYGWSQRPSQ